MLIQSSKSFFKAELETFFKNNKVDPSPLTKNYLVDVLEKFVSTENLFPQKKSTYLFDLYKEYIESPSKTTKQNTLLYLADYSLFVSGFMPAKILKQNLSLSYYVDMGSNAYLSLYGLNKSNPTFIDLSSNFTTYMNGISFLNKGFDKNIPLFLEQWNVGKNKEALNEILKKGFIPKF